MVHNSWRVTNLESPRRLCRFLAVVEIDQGVGAVI